MIVALLARLAKIRMYRMFALDAASNSTRTLKQSYDGREKRGKIERKGVRRYSRGSTAS